MFQRNSEGISRKHDSINTDAFDLKLLHWHCCQMIDCPLRTPYPHPSTPPWKSYILKWLCIETLISAHKYWSIFKFGALFNRCPDSSVGSMLDFFLWIWPDQTWSERVRVQFPIEEHDFLSLFKLIILSFLYMHVYHITIKSSQKLWAIYRK